MTVAVLHRPALAGRASLVETAIGVLLALFLAIVFRLTVTNPFLLEPSLAWTIVCIGFGAAIVGLHAAIGRTCSITVFDRLLIAYVLCVLVTWPFGADRSTTALAIVKLGGQLAVYWSLRLIVEHRPAVGRVVVAAVIVGIAYVEWAAADYHLRHGLATRLLIIPTVEWNGRSGVSFIGAIQFGLVAGLWHDADRARDRVAIVVLLVAATVELVFLYSRAPWIAMLAVIAAGFVVGVRRRTVLSYAVVAAAIGVAAALLATPYTAHLAKVAFGVETGAEAGPASRLLLWRDAVAVIRRHPIAGVGLGNFMSVHQTLFPVVSPQLGTGESAFTHPHNLFLQQFAETGIAGGLAYVGLWATALGVGWRLASARSPVVPAAAALFLAVLAICVVDLGENMFLDGVAAERIRLHTIAWIVLAVLIGRRPRRAARLATTEADAMRDWKRMRVVFLSACALLAAYEAWAVFLRRAPAVAIEGRRQRVIEQAADGPVVSQIFEMTAGGITAIDLRVSTDTPATLLLRCRLSDVTETAAGVDEALVLRHRSAAPAKLTASWFVTMKRVSGMEWRRLTVPDGRAFVPGMYELWLQLADVQADRRDRNPVSASSPVHGGFVASVDNVLGGGSLWIGDQRQLGSLSIRVYSQARNAFAQFRADTASDLPGVLASAPVMIGLAVVYQASIVAVVYMLAIGRRDALSPSTSSG